MTWIFWWLAGVMAVTSGASSGGAQYTSKPCGVSWPQHAPVYFPPTPDYPLTEELLHLEQTSFAQPTRTVSTGKAICPGVPAQSPCSPAATPTPDVEESKNFPGRYVMTRNQLDPRMTLTYLFDTATGELWEMSMFPPDEEWGKVKVDLPWKRSKIISRRFELIFSVRKVFVFEPATGKAWRLDHVDDLTKYSWVEVKKK